jgi:hypothetical protein
MVKFAQSRWSQKINALCGIEKRHTEKKRAGKMPARLAQT